MTDAPVITPVFDADNHYYEALDAFTRYGEPEFAKRTMQWAEIDGKLRLLVGGKLNRFLGNPTFDKLARPGCLEQYFRGNNPEGTDVLTLFGELEPTDPAYRDREVRIKVMDDIGIAGALFFPTLGVGMEQALSDDLPAMMSAFRSFNRWLDDDWGFAYQDKVFGIPYLTLADVDNAIAELEWVLDRGARLVLFQYGPVLTESGWKSPGDPIYDPVWARIEEAGITVAYHGGDSAYSKLMPMWGESAQLEAHRFAPLRGALSWDAIHDTFAALVLHGVLDRFRGIRFVAVETGSGWVAPLLQKIGKAYKQTPKVFPRDPREAFREQVYVSPFYENDLAELRGLVGAQHILLGSDWPHTEGLEDPLSFTRDLTDAGFTEAEQHLVMHDNCAALVRPA
jgi:predicted TIM-barrel fold metal-dependent hydrolase